MTHKQQGKLECKFDLIVKYKKLQEQEFDNHQIVQMIPAMCPILDTTNMPVHMFSWTKVLVNWRKEQTRTIGD
jgi:hypothetical protein